MMTKHDVVIVGGGAIGLCSAYFLAQRGASVVVLDKGEPGHGSSLHNAGYISPSHFVPLAAPGVFTQGLKWMFNPTSPLYIKPRFDLDFFSWAWRFARACDHNRALRAMPLLLELLLESSKLTKEMSAVKGMEFGLSHRGIVLLYNTERGKKSCLHEHELAERLGLESTMLDLDQLHDQDPGIGFRAPGGLFFPADSHLVPATFVKNLSDYLLGKRIVVVSNSPISKFMTSESRVTAVVTPSAQYEAGDFVMAGGAWAPLLLRDIGIRMHLQAGKGYSITLERPAVNPTRPYILSERRVAVTPFATSLRFAGTMELAGIDTSINMPRVEAILDAVPQYFENIARPSSSAGMIWGGMRPVTPDGLPYIGRFKQFGNLIAATGHAMLGISLAAVTGKLVSEIISNQKPSHDLELVNPNRYD
jgi:D-amino-acid dehydrogenase